MGKVAPLLGMGPGSLPLVSVTTTLVTLPPGMGSAGGGRARTSGA